jgi:hypothetical protein
MSRQTLILTSLVAAVDDACQDFRRDVVGDVGLEPGSSTPASVAPWHGFQAAERALADYRRAMYVPQLSV